MSFRINEQFFSSFLQNINFNWIIKVRHDRCHWWSISIEQRRFSFMNRTNQLNAYRMKLNQKQREEKLCLISQSIWNFSPKTPCPLIYPLKAIMLSSPQSMIKFPYLIFLKQLYKKPIMSYTPWLMCKSHHRSIDRNHHFTFRLHGKSYLER